MIDRVERLTKELNSKKNGIYWHLEALDTVFESLPVSVLAKDGENNLLYVNDHLAAELGLPAEDIAGKHASVFWIDADQYLPADHEVMTSGKLKVLIEPVSTSGYSGTVCTLKYPLRIRGKVIGVIAVFFDVTDELRRINERT